MLPVLIYFDYGHYSLRLNWRGMRGFSHRQGFSIFPLNLWNMENTFYFLHWCRKYTGRPIFNIYLKRCLYKVLNNLICIYSQQIFPVVHCTSYPRCNAYRLPIFIPVLDLFLYLGHYKVISKLQCLDLSILCRPYPEVLFLKTR